MKKCFFILAVLMSIKTLSAQPFYLRDSSPSMERSVYLSRRYNCSPEQVSSYEELLRVIFESRSQLNKRVLTKEERKESLSKVKTIFYEGVRGIFNTDQYSAWRIDNRDKESIRWYRENYNLDDNQLDQLLTILKESKQAFNLIVNERMSYAERVGMQRDIYQTRDDGIRRVIQSKELADSFILSINWEDKASFVRRYMPELTYEVSYRLGKLFWDYTAIRYGADWSGRSSREKQAIKHDAYSLLMKQIKETLTPEEYEVWTVRYYEYHDKVLCFDLNMTELDFNVYKQIMNYRAIKRLKVARQGYDNDRKQLLFDKIDEETKFDITEQISKEAADMWYSNLMK